MFRLLSKERSCFFKYLFRFVRWQLFYKKIPFNSYKTTILFFPPFLFLIFLYIEALLCSYLLLMGAVFLLYLMSFDDVCLDLCAESVSDMSVSNNTTRGAGGVLRFSPPYSVDEHFPRRSSRLNSGCFAIFPAGASLTVMIGRSEREVALAGW